ncbi:hypothetical protein [Helicobacter heilmannii]|uniref:hypothetical protein n=1 Tax=Helicobacter heilmannii TaxID=35817 RepID=UPI0006A0C55E|nr:hypothetical protein [Helicobacter heilmannii]CRF45844.1 hypothetical protein HHE014_08220 [Helicobacter heilmannii]CRF48386.1 hypothetical protein HHE02_17110 [Helicobacter heilmannii]CRF50001.1 hypothetical protein HHE03_16940 [Helicobacter heilmannii]CRF51781.1 hypothetical protein HHE06_16850 [Helicobacter heilmannii]GMB94696.1 hypothetical protein NHP21011_07890 [Helicobacter heilmannii]
MPNRLYNWGYVCGFGEDIPKNETIGQMVRTDSPNTHNIQNAYKLPQAVHILNITTEQLETLSQSENPPNTASSKDNPSTIIYRITRIRQNF